jgi:hypothetical protein
MGRRIGAQVGIADEAGSLVAPPPSPLPASLSFAQALLVVVSFNK